MTNYVMAQSQRGSGGRYDLRELRDIAIEALLDIVTEPIGHDSDRSARGVKVAAASRLLAHTEWQEERDSAPEDAFLQLMGDPQKALIWLRTMVPKLEAMQVRTMAERSVDDDAEDSK